MIWQIFNVLRIHLIKKDGKFYTGYTSDLKTRYKEHETGQVESTKSRRPMLLVFYEAYREEQDARSRERFIKTTKGKIQLKKQLQHFLHNYNLPG